MSTAKLLVFMPLKLEIGNIFHLNTEFDSQ